VTERDSLYAFLAVLAAIIVLAICGTVAVNSGKDATVYGSAIVGLVGVIGTFRPRSSTQNVEKAETVNQGSGAT
jgi:hypothetical protein